MEGLQRPHNRILWERLQQKQTLGGLNQTHLKITERPGTVAAIAGAVMSLAAFFAAKGLPPLAAAVDPVIWIVLLVIALFGAFASYSTLRAFREVARNRAWLVAALVGAIAGGWSRSAEFVQESREAQRFAASADTTTGEVFRKYVRGGVHLFIRYHAHDQIRELHLVGENPLIGRRAFSTLEVGDSVRVFFRPDAPGDAMIGPPGPERWLLVQYLLKMCTAFAILFAAYIPPLARLWRSGRSRPAT